MRIISREELYEIIDKHKRWLKGERGGEQADLSDTYLQGFNLQGVDLREANLANANLKFADLRSANLQSANLLYANLRYASLQETNLRDVELYATDLRWAYRSWLVYAGNLGSRRAETIYFADYDNINCGCWRDFKGGTLTEFKARVDEIYPSDSENEAYQKYRAEYISAIKMFESMRAEYLARTSEK